MSLRLYNTLTRRVEPLEPLEPGFVRMYTCGPTVYSFVHIGNLRTFVFQDLLRRYIKYKGYRIFHVMNITDVDDKIIERSREAGVSLSEYTRKYSEAFLDDLDTLRIERPEEMPRATDHITDMVELVQRLKARNLTYERDGSTYFRIDSLPEYGKLARVELESQSEQARIDSDEYDKQNLRDFALWKCAKPGEASWKTVLGDGRPGWHLECSAMSMKYLGESFDIHTGGVDLVFPHHENEIAQSEGATGKPFVRHWVHGAHLIVNGEKMSKSKGNFFTLRDLLEKGASPVALRYLFSAAHYRHQLNFSFGLLKQARSALQRVDDLLQRVRAIADGVPSSGRLEEAIGRARVDFEAGMDNDLNTSEALAALFELVREVNKALADDDVGSTDRDAVLDVFRQANQIFDVFRVEAQSLPDNRIEELIEERRQARMRRGFDRADEIRDELLELGIVLEDTKEGTRWKRAR